ncbi:hypothetical protein HDU97_000803 [Phlyctochytrium planicorne]|nr:hypothetical protein HDU97_000803 [Phlyctochytrium planicorne]
MFKAIQQKGFDTLRQQNQLPRPVPLVDQDDEDDDNELDFPREGRRDPRISANMASSNSLNSVHYGSTPHMANNISPNDPNYLPLEYTSITGYTTYLPGLFLFYLLSVLTLGVLPLLAFRFPRFKARLTRTPVNSFLDAEWVLLQSHRGVIEEVPVKRIVATPTTQQQQALMGWSGRWSSFQIPNVIAVSGGWTSTFSNGVINSMFGEDQEELHPQGVVELMDGGRAPVMRPVFTYFEYKKQRYVYSNSGMSFVRMNGRLSMGFTQIHSLRSGLTMVDAASLLDRNGPNQIHIDSIPVGVMLIDKISQPFYLFQFASVLIWFYESYTAYAIIILVTSTLSILWEIVTAKQNEKSLRELAGDATPVGQAPASSATSLNPGSIPSTPSTANFFSSSRASIDIPVSASQPSINSSISPNFPSLSRPRGKNIATVLREGRLIDIDSSYLVVGDAVILDMSMAGMVAVADMVIIQGGVVVDESSLTGEATPVYKFPLPVVEPGVSSGVSTRAGGKYGYNPEKNKGSTVFGGSKILEVKPAKHVLARPGEDAVRVVGVVTGTGFYSTRGELFRSILFPKEIDFKFYRDSFKFIGALSIVALAAFINRVINGVSQDLPTFWVVVTSLDLITIAVPPALPLILTVGIGLALQRLKQKNIFCISPERINYAGRIDVFCWDKTGTLTTPRLSWAGLDACVASTEANAGQDTRPSTVGPNLEGLRPFFNHTDHINLERAVAVCHTLNEIRGELLGPPLEVELFEATRWKMVQEEEVLNAGAGKSPAEMPVAIFYPPTNEVEEEVEGGATLSVPAPHIVVPEIIASGATTFDVRGSVNSFSSGSHAVSSSHESGFIVSIEDAPPANPPTLSPTRHQRKCSKILHLSNTGIYVLKRFEFDAQLQRCSVVFRTTSASTPSYMACVKGSPESVLRVCNPATIPRNYHEAYTRYASKGFYVLAVAERTISSPSNGGWKREQVEREMSFLGFVMLQNPLKPESEAVVGVLNGAGVRSVIITGDGSMTAISVSRDLGICDNVILVDVFEHGLGFQRLKSDSPKLLATSQSHIAETAELHDDEDIDIEAGEESQEELEQDDPFEDPPEFYASGEFESDRIGYTDDVNDVRGSVASLRDSVFRSKATAAHHHTSSAIRISKSMGSISASLSGDQGSAINLPIRHHPRPNMIPASLDIKKTRSSTSTLSFPIEELARTMAALDATAGNAPAPHPFSFSPFTSPTPLAAKAKGGWEIAVTGAALDAMLNGAGGATVTDGFLDWIVWRTSIFSRMKPGHKAWIVERLIRQGRYVGMCGDGANDTGALKAAHVGLALSDSEASIVAPFTSFMFMYPIVQLIMVATLNQMGSGLSNNQFLFDDMAIVLVLAILMLRSGASHVLGPSRPTDNLFSPLVTSSLLGHVLICIGFFVANVASLYDQPWFCGIWKAREGLDVGGDWTPLNKTAPYNVSYPCYYVDPLSDVTGSNLLTTHENTVIWLFTHFQFAILALAFCLSSPHRRPAWTNPSFTLYLLFCLASLSAMLLFSDNQTGFTQFAFLFNIREGVPYEFRVGCLILAACHTGVSLLWEIVVVDQGVRRWVVGKEAREQEGVKKKMEVKAGITAQDALTPTFKLRVRLHMAAAMRAASSWHQPGRDRYTQLTNKLAALGEVDRIRDVLNPPFELIINTVHKRFGSVIKLAGDSAIVAWTIPRQNDSKSLKSSRRHDQKSKDTICNLALLCCMELIKLFENYNINVDSGQKQIPLTECEFAEENEASDTVGEKAANSLSNDEFPSPPKPRDVKSAERRGSKVSMGRFSETMRKETKGGARRPSTADTIQQQMPRPPMTRDASRRSSITAGQILQNISSKRRQSETGTQMLRRGSIKSIKKVGDSEHQKLSLHIGLGFGDMHHVFVGRLTNADKEMEESAPSRAEYFIAGRALHDAGIMLNQGKSGHIVFSDTGLQEFGCFPHWQRFKDLATGNIVISTARNEFIDLESMMSLLSRHDFGDLESNLSKDLDFTGFVEWSEGQLSKAPKRDERLLAFIEPSLTKHVISHIIHEDIKGYFTIPTAPNAEEIACSSNMNQYRTITSLFLCLQCIPVDRLGNPRIFKDVEFIASTVMRIAVKHGGTCRQIHADEKAMSALLIWGIEGFSHEKGDQAYAVAAGMDIERLLKAHKWWFEDRDKRPEEADEAMLSKFSIAVTMGKAYVI